MKWQSFTNKQKAYIIGSSVVLLILLWSFFSARILTTGLNRQNLTQSGDNKSAIAEGIILTETKDEVKYWEVYGDEGLYDSQKDITTLNGVLANFYKENDVSMSIKSAQAEYNSKERVITLFDDVFVVLKDGFTLSSDKLVWSGGDKPIFAYGHVIITKGDEYMANADEVEISANYDDIKIKGNTISRVYDRSYNGKKK